MDFVKQKQKDINIDNKNIDRLNNSLVYTEIKIYMLVLHLFVSFDHKNKNKKRLDVYLR